MLLKVGPSERREGVWTETYVGLAGVEEHLSSGLVTVKLGWQCWGRGLSSWGGLDGSGIC